MFRSLSTFTPRQAADVSGVSADVQRVWRKRGYMPLDPDAAAPGWTRITYVGLAALIVTKIAADFEQPLHMAKVIGETAAPHVAFYVSLNLSDTEGDYFRESFDLDGGHRFLVISEKGMPGLYGDLAPAFDGHRFIGTVVDLKAIGDELFRVLPKPIVQAAMATAREAE
jgi:hypothetical protein